MTSTTAHFDPVAVATVVPGDLVVGLPGHTRRTARTVDLGALPGVFNPLLPLGAATPQAGSPGTHAPEVS